MSTTTKDTIKHKQIIRQRINLIELLKDYQSIDNFSNVYNRFKKNSNKKSVIWFLVLFIICFIIYVIGLVFLRKYIYIVIIAWIISAVIVILLINKMKHNIVKFYNEMISNRDDDICKLLIKKGVNSKNINYIIDYFVLNLEPVSTVYKETPILNSISRFGSYLFFLILGIIIPDIIKEKSRQNNIETYAIVFAVLFLIGFSVLIIKVYSYFNKKDMYLYKIRKLVIDLKQIDLLNKIK